MMSETKRCPHFSPKTAQRLARCVFFHNNMIFTIKKFQNTEVLSQLYAAHQEGKSNFGFNIEVNNKFN